MTTRPDFLIEEYRALREEILFHAAHSRRLELSMILGIGAIYGWSPAAGEEVYRTLVWWVPPLFALLGAFREFGNRSRASQIAMYIKEIEETFSEEIDAKAKAKGWEHFLDLLREDYKNRYLGISHWCFWASIFVITVAIAICKTT